MYRLSTFAAAALVALAMPAPGAAETVVTSSVRPLPPEARDAAAAVDAFHEALRRDDPRAALALVADDAIVFEDGRVERSKAEYALHHAAADAAFSKAVASKRLSRTAQVAGGGLALVLSESRTKGRFRDQDVDRIMVETMVLRRDRGSWKIVHIHWSAAEPSTE